MKKTSTPNHLTKYYTADVCYIMHTSKNNYRLIAVDLSRPKELDALPKKRSGNRVPWTIKKSRRCKSHARKDQRNTTEILPRIRNTLIKDGKL